MITIALDDMSRPPCTIWSPDGYQPISLLAARVDGETPPVVLYDDLDVSVYDGDPLVTFQTWSQQQG